MKFTQNIKFENFKFYLIHAVWFCNLILLAATIGLMFSLPNNDISSFFAFSEKDGWRISTGATVLIIFNFIFIIFTLIFYSYYRKLNLSFSWIFNTSMITLIATTFIFLIIALCTKPYNNELNSNSLIFTNTNDYTSAGIGIMSFGIIALIASIVLYSTDWILKFTKGNNKKTKKDDIESVGFSTQNIQDQISK